LLVAKLEILDPMLSMQVALTSKRRNRGAKRLRQNSPTAGPNCDANNGMRPGSPFCMQIWSRIASCGRASSLAQHPR
jgi:hypothetical protein